MAKYFRLRSSLKQPTTVNYTRLGADKKNISVNVEIPGKMNPKSSDSITFISEAEFNELMKPIAGKPSSFSIFCNDGAKGKSGVVVMEAKLAELPDALISKYEPDYFIKLEATRKKEAAKQQELLEKQKEA